MNPAYSVILFTVLSGVGYGLLAVLGLLCLFSLNAASVLMNISVLLISLILITAGLISSTSHLGRPERAWRALSQWRTSWLSREGVLAVLTYVPALLLALIWGIEFVPENSVLWAELWAELWKDEIQTYISVIGGVAGLFAISTVFCTGQIYASLRTIPAWHYSLTTPIYCVLSITSGLLLWIFLSALFGYDVNQIIMVITIGMLEASLILKWVYWRYVDSAEFGVTKADAIGFETQTQVQNLEPSNQTQNYLMREMGYHIARKHALKLRRYAALAGFIMPALLLLLVFVNPSYALVFSFAAIISYLLGLLIERWLFFAEAKHIVTLYY